MFRLSKYELRKNVLGILIILGVIGGVEIYFIISALIGNRDHTAAASVFLVMAAMVAYFGVLIVGIASYSKELNRKTGYMTFMTPISSFTVIGSKLLTTFAAGVFFAVLLAVLAVFDMGMFERVFPESKILTELIEEMSEMAGNQVGELWVTLGVRLLSTLVQSFAIVAIAYLSITLTATAFQNKKGKGVMSVIFFVLIMVAYSKIADIIPDIYETAVNWTQGIVNLIPLIVYMAVVAVVCIFVSAKLLDKRVSL